MINISPSIFNIKDQPASIIIIYSKKRTNLKKKIQNNQHQLQSHRDHYSCTFPALVASWRNHFSLRGPTRSKVGLDILQLKYQSCMCSEQFHFILVSFSSEAPFGFVQLAPYREGVKVSGNNQSPCQRSGERIPLTRYWLLSSSAK